MRYLLAFVLTLPLAAADFEAGKAEERRACTSCHGLRIIHVQRLPRGTWERELTKMEGWGTVIKDRAALLEYLAASYSDTTPPPAALLSGDGRKK
jgi:hypothetical protein